ncbi:MATE family efflux transporter [Pseudogulbenkiania subflava]|uniref:Uncharacterized protein n=1 Tax=Pseudogulbenkiania subflava DSM 22618 TaxID=1123014 RepID=A0A1Y6C246_9NEIS|nr:hypothetical protein [Pseudogulbenkiania subflava]SMF31602.1 hypothetical protein SAMN02745746_02535 [Pseudogulbenkiania subflava DSM 22618]
MKKKESLDAGFTFAHAGFNELQNKFLNEALENYRNNVRDAIRRKDGLISDQSLSVKQGLVAEAHHAESYNIRAASQGKNNHRASRDTGVHNDPKTDIRVKTPDETVDFQLKYNGDADQTAAQMSHPDYDDVGKVGPAEQIGGIKESAKRRAQRNQETRPEVSKSNQHTADNVDDNISAGGVSSDPLNRKGKGGSEDLTKQAESNPDGPEYAHEGEVRMDFNAMQYRNAIKSGLISGACMQAATELYDVLNSDKKLTQEECMAIGKRIATNAVESAGKAALVTGIQHVGQAMVDSASQAARQAAAKSATGAAASAATSTVGKHLVKGNVAAVAATIAIDLGNNIYAFANGEIDSVEFAAATIGSSVQAVGGTLAYSAGTATAAFMGQYVAAGIGQTAVLGTTLGALGPIAVGAVFAIGFSVAVGAYTNHFSSIGQEIAIADIKYAADQLGCGNITLTEYTGVVGTMTEFSFRWTDILPFAGAISVFSEYGSRKRQLQSVRSEMYSRMDALDEQERLQMAEMLKQFDNHIAEIERNYEHARQQLSEQAFGQFDQMREALDQHLEMNYVMFAPIRKSHQQDVASMDMTKKLEEEHQSKMKSYEDELNNLARFMNYQFGTSPEDQKARSIIEKTLRSRLELLVPARTGFDKACEFLLIEG